MVFLNRRYRFAGERLWSVNCHRRSAVALYDNLVKYDIPKCEHPIYLASRHQYVPCGHCALCASLAKKDWIVRCNLELQKYKRGEFITLTFDDEHLYDTSYDVVQKFLKRLRKKCISPFKYFCAYENGDKSGRPHYHILIFGFSRPYPVDPMWFNAYLADIWQQGIVKAVPMTSGNIPYVCGYVQKKLQNTQKLPSGMCRRDFTRLNLHSLNDLELSLSCNQTIHRQEFTKMSKGLGFWWCEDIKRIKTVLRKGYFQFGKFRYAIPRALLLKLQQLGNDWLCGDVFYKFLADREQSFKRDPSSFVNLSNHFSRRDVYNEPNGFIEFVLSLLRSSGAYYRQVALNSRMRM